jgi:NAD-dependent SIR2 family protein deacetylase
MSEERDFQRFVIRRSIVGSQFFLANCVNCGGEMKVCIETLRKEWEGRSPKCRECSGPSIASYGGSPQESHDIAYHGSRFHSAEW